MAQQLATVTDLQRLGHLPQAIASMSDDVKNAHLMSASQVALSYCKKRYGTPLVQWGDDLRGAVVAIAGWTLLCQRGFNPANSADLTVRERHDQAVNWLRDIAKGLAELVDVIDSTPETEEASPLVASEPRQRWMWGMRRCVGSADDDPYGGLD